MSGAGPHSADEIRAQTMCRQIDFIAGQQKAGGIAPALPDLEGLLAGVVAWGQCALSPEVVVQVLEEAKDRLAKRLPTGTRPSLKVIAGSKRG